MYKPVKTPHHIDLNIRDLRYRLHCWGDETGIPVMLLHGWADVGMSFQFLADAMSDQWYLIAPDWRGFGDTQWQTAGYWFPDYLGDLDAIIDQMCQEQPIRLVGHSMGGNVAWLYAGVRPDRVSHTVSLDVYGLTDCSPANAPAQYSKWLNQLKHNIDFSYYPDISGVVERLNKLAPGLSEDRARFLGSYWCNQDDNGRYQYKHDPAHKRINPILYRREEAKSCWGQIKANTLLVMAKESTFYETYQREDYKMELANCIESFTEAVVEDSNHMIHLEQPVRLAEILDRFLQD